jgi:hypothetical protein
VNAARRATTASTLQIPLFVAGWFLVEYIVVGRLAFAYVPLFIGGFISLGSHCRCSTRRVTARSRTWRKRGLPEAPGETGCMRVTRSSTRRHRAEPSTIGYASSRRRLQPLMICAAPTAMENKGREDSHQIFRSVCRIEACSSGTSAMTMSSERRIRFCSSQAVKPSA